MTKWQEVALGIQYVKRYHMCDMGRQQNVAEHSFNVAMIVLETSLWLYDLKRTEGFGEGVSMQSYREAEIGRRVMMALTHDLPEFFTGDLDYWVKAREEMNGSWKAMEEGVVTEFIESLPEYMKNIMNRVMSPMEQDSLDYCLVKQADYLELTNFCMNDAERGNKKSLKIAGVGLKLIHKYDHEGLEPRECPLRKLEASLKIKFRELGGQ